MEVTDVWQIAESFSNQQVLYRLEKGKQKTHLLKTVDHSWKHMEKP